MTGMDQSAIKSLATTSTDIGPWSPLRSTMFRWLWLAALFSNIGTWIHEVAAGWLMTEIATSPLLVALVQAATMSPVFLLSLPAGALADTFDRRKLLLFAQAWSFLTAGVLAVLTFAGLVTPGLLLFLVAMMAIGAAVHMPAFQAIVPELVPRAQLKPAVTLNGVAVNVARAVGPAIAGLIISGFGVGAAFAVNALTFIAVFVVVLAWKREQKPVLLPPEHLIHAVVVGLRYAKNDRPLKIILARAALFMLFASAAWALMPLVIRSELGRGAAGYGIALTAIGVGAVSGVFILPRFGRMVSTDKLAVAAALMYAGGMASMAYVKSFPVLVVCLVPLGLAWLIMMTTLNASAQAALPDWVRARGIAVFMIVFAGSMAGGAAAWGALAGLTSVPTALTIAACGAAVGCLFAPLLPLGSADSLQLVASKHMPVHTYPDHDAADSGPVQVLIHYDIAASDQTRFMTLMEDLRRWRLRTGAHSWALYRDLDVPQRWVESFSVSSWHEHLRQHLRTTEDDYATQQAVFALHHGEGKPRITHLVTPGPGGNLPDGALLDLTATKLPAH